jgi:hypothetical protein
VCAWAEAQGYLHLCASCSTLNSTYGCPCVGLSADQPLLLPLTGSLYVKGKVADTQQLLVNIGTDYYVEVSVAQKHRAIQCGCARTLAVTQWLHVYGPFSALSHACVFQNGV